jgi:hypothetical protein
MRVLQEADSWVIGEHGKEWTDAVASILERCGEHKEIPSGWLMLRKHDERVWDVALLPVLCVAWHIIERHVSVLHFFFCSGVDFDSVCAV